ncbi:gas vesicle protein GvpJ [Sporohalobacter salinus]|uniref:gas vesicle protein GvpJ n=1 Tax=Sporohalobacter salinus TaxID=1494606 RepID=UPI0019609857|nr:hypothetical protein [Sporohalobacter salinus]
MPSNSIARSTSASGIGEILERILDRGVVIAGDISVALADIELLTIKIRLIVASVDKAKEIGIDWWTMDPSLSSLAHEDKEGIEKTKAERFNDLERAEIIKRLENIEAKLDD